MKPLRSKTNHAGCVYAGLKPRSGQIVATSAEATPNGGLEKESPQHALNSNLGMGAQISMTNG